MTNMPSVHHVTVHSLNVRNRISKVSENEHNKHPRPLGGS